MQRISHFGTSRRNHFDPIIVYKYVARLVDCIVSRGKKSVGLFDIVRFLVHDKFAVLIEIIIRFAEFYLIFRSVRIYISFIFFDKQQAHKRCLIVYKIILLTVKSPNAVKNNYAIVSDYIITCRQPVALSYLQRCPDRQFTVLSGMIALAIIHHKSGFRRNSVDVIIEPAVQFNNARIVSDLIVPAQFFGSVFRIASRSNRKRNIRCRKSFITYISNIIRKPNLKCM